MRLSKYNFFFPFKADESKVIAYNARTSSLALMEKDKYEMIDNYIKNGTEIRDEDFIKELGIGGFVIDDNLNELDSIKHKLLSNRYSSSYLSLTIAPTLDCNFRCKYCYEKNSMTKEYMSKEIQGKIIDMVKQKIRFIEKFAVTWYGGEPLLAIDVVEYLSKEFIKICEENNVAYSAGIVTNGYHLSRENAELLASLKVNSVQVTLDGPRDIHNQRRPSIDGQDSFDRIINNLADNAALFNSVSLRINVDKENIDKKEQLLQILREKGLKDKVHIYLGYVEPTNDCYQKNSCMAYNRFAKETLDFKRYLIREGFLAELAADYPWSKTNYCGADFQNSFVIAPNGGMYKCWSDIGIEAHKAASLNADEKLNLSKQFEYMLYDPTTDPKCSECRLLPMCMGGCPRRRLDTSVDRCSHFKYILGDYIDECANALYQKMLSENAACCIDEDNQ